MEATAATIDEHPMWINLEKAYQELQGYPEAELDRKVLTVIASYANSQGIAFPLQATVADVLGEIKMTVNRSVHRLIDKCFIKVLRKEKKYNDIHPRCIYGIASDMVRETPDMRSSHFDAEKFRVIAARLRKHVTDAVDTVKQVAAGFAENMANAKARQRSKKQWKQNNSYPRPYYSYENKRAAQPPVYTRPEHDGPGPLERRVMDSLFDLGLKPWGDAFQKAGHYMLDHLSNEPTDDEYDAMFQEAVGKFDLPKTPHVPQPSVNDRLRSSSVQEVRLMSSEDEPKTVGDILGAAFA